jgi:hypothetical protein
VASQVPMNIHGTYRIVVEIELDAHSRMDARNYLNEAARETARAARRQVHEKRFPIKIIRVDAKILGEDNIQEEDREPTA